MFSVQVEQLSVPAPSTNLLGSLKPHTLLQSSSSQLDASIVVDTTSDASIIVDTAANSLRTGKTLYKATDDSENASITDPEPTTYNSDLSDTEYSSDPTIVYSDDIADPEPIAYVDTNDVYSDIADPEPYNAVYSDDPADPEPIGYSNDPIIGYDDSVVYSDDVADPEPVGYVSDVNNAYDDSVADPEPLGYSSDTSIVYSDDVADPEPVGYYDAADPEPYGYQGYGADPTYQSYSG